MEKRRPYDKLKPAVYRAEDKLEGRMGFGKDFDSITEILTWAIKIHSRDPLFRGVPYVAVHASHGNAKASWACFEDHSITMVESQMNEQVVLHELAHLITDSMQPLHGLDYCWNYLDLTLRWRGTKVYLALRDAMREEGIFL